MLISCTTIKRNAIPKKYAKLTCVCVQNRIQQCSSELVFNWHFTDSKSFDNKSKALRLHVGGRNYSLMVVVHRSCNGDPPAGVGAAMTVQDDPGSPLFCFYGPFCNGALKLYPIDNIYNMFF